MLLLFPIPGEKYPNKVLLFAFLNSLITSPFVGTDQRERPLLLSLHCPQKVKGSGLGRGTQQQGKAVLGTPLSEARATEPRLGGVRVVNG